MDPEASAPSDGSSVDSYLQLESGTDDISTVVDSEVTEDDDDMDTDTILDVLEEESDLFETETEQDDIEIEIDIPGSFPTDADASDEAQLEVQGEGVTQTRAMPLHITREQLMMLLNRSGDLRTSWLRQLLSTARGDDDDDEDDEDYREESASPNSGRSDTRRMRQRAPPAPLEPVPNSNGTLLMESGAFGTNVRNRDSVKRSKHIAAQILGRELGREAPGKELANGRFMRQNLVPSSRTDMVVNYNSRCYSGQFSKDGNFFFSCAQDFKVRMYDTSNPYQWQYYKTVRVPVGQWTITDATLSPDNRFLAASSIQNIVTLASTDPSQAAKSISDVQHLDFARMSPESTARARGRVHGWRGYGHFGIWSLRFSGDGREIVAGTGDNSVYVYDLERQQSILRIPGHDADVNAVCYGDEMSPHVLFSGSDDCTLKVWDRRSMGDGRAAGVFLGHVEGLTYVDAKGDGRYVLSNGKDQTMKLWDLRKVVPTEDADNMHFSNPSFDYRSASYPQSQWRPHPNDCSLVTFRGHAVLSTLIRCHFSPANSSDGRYVYSGSQEGKVWIWNLDGTVKQTIDVYRGTKGTRAYDSSSARHSWGMSGGSWKTVVRDASWHPNVPMIAATSWNGYSAGWGSCTVHSWYDDGDGSEEDIRESPNETPKMYDAVLGDWHATQGRGPDRPRTRAARRAAPRDDNSDDTD